jgi:hypothetical protein
MGGVCCAAGANGFFNHGVHKGGTEGAKGFRCSVLWERMVFFTTECTKEIKRQKTQDKETREGFRCGECCRLLMDEMLKEV